MTRRKPYPWILTAILAPALVWLMLPVLAQRMATTVLDRAGFDVAMLEVATVGLSGAALRRLEMTHRDSATRVTMSGVEIEYSLPDAVRGQLEKLRLEHVEIRPGASRVDFEFAPADLLDLPLSTWRQAFPVRTLAIDRAELVKDGAVYGFGVGTSRLEEGMAVRVSGLGGLAGRGVEALLAHDGSWSARVTGAVSEAAPDIAAHGDGDAVELRWRGELEQLRRWLGSTAAGLEWPDCRGEAALGISRNPLDAVSVSARLDRCAAAGLVAEDVRVEARFMGSAEGLTSVSPARLEAARVVVGDVLGEKLGLRAGLDVDTGDWSLRVIEGARATARRVRVAGFDLAAVESVSNATFDPLGTLPALRIAVGGLSYADAGVAVSVRDIDADIRPAQTGLRAVASARQVEVADPEYRAVLEQATVRASVEDGVAGGDYEALLAGLAPMRGAFDGLGGARTRVTLGLAPVRFGERIPGIAALVEGLPPELAVVAGTLGIEAAAEFTASGPMLDIDLSLQDGGGAVDGVVFSGADTELALRLLPELSMARPATLVVDVVDFGFALSDVSARVALAPGVSGPQVAIDDVVASILGGALAIPRMRIADDTPLEIELVLSSIDLERLEVGDYIAGLELEGRLSGRVPVRVTAGAPSVSGGLLVNDIPGVVRYGAGADGADSGAEILFRALRELRYDRLTVEPEYHADGTLLLRLRLEGTSSEFGAGQPIHFNVNVEQNMLSLLESVRLVNGLNEDIDRRVQAWYQRQQSNQPEPGISP